MKKYSIKIKQLNIKDNEKEISDIPMIELLTKLGVEDPKPIMSSKEFSEYWYKHVSQMAMFKKYDANSRKWRDTSYSSIGIMDLNDILQEASLCFLEAWKNVDWDKINEVDVVDRDKALWGFLKSSTTLRLSTHIRGNKDGMRITDHGLFKSKESVEKNKNVKAITSLFARLDNVLLDHEAEMAVTKHENDLIGTMLEDIMDEVLDKKSNGGQKEGGIEKFVLMNIMGIDGHMTYDELSDYFNVSKQSLMSVKKRALKKMRTPEVMSKISEFMEEYKLNTGSNARNFENN